MPGRGPSLPITALSSTCLVPSTILAGEMGAVSPLSPEGMREEEAAQRAVLGQAGLSGRLQGSSR